MTSISPEILNFIRSCKVFTGASKIFTGPAEISTQSLIYTFAPIYCALGYLFFFLNVQNCIFSYVEMRKNQ